MNNRTIKVAIAIVLLLVAAGLISIYGSSSTMHTPVDMTPTSTTPTTSESTTITLTGGELTLTYPQSKYGLAVKPEQVLVHSYIPPCSEGFDYCFYYNADEYKGTNFESAALGIKRRTDLSRLQACLNAPPEGYENDFKPSETNDANLYSASIFRNIGDAGAGHYAEGSLYRLFVKGSSFCYEFETRIGATQFQNYPSGTIREFTTEARRSVENSLKAILESMQLGAQNTQIALPL